MAWKRNITIVAVLLLLTGLFFGIKEFVNRPRIKVNTNDLVFLSNKDITQLHTDIDSAKTVPELDYKILDSLSEIFDTYNAVRTSDNDYIISPEFMSDNPESIQVINGNNKTDLLAGVQITPLTEEDLPNLKKFLHIFFEEYSKYPLAWMKLTTPPVIVFAKSLSADVYKGEVIGGIETGVVTYNISGVDDIPYTRRLIHHELLHWFDTKKDKGIEFWPEGITHYSNSYDLKSLDNYTEYPSEGFVTGYAKTNSWEDKAEVYAYLFTKDGSQKLNQWIKTDKKLEAKVNYLKNLIKSKVSKMDDEYFNQKILNY